MPAVDPRAVAVVTVNWNGWANTLKCLAALRTSVGAEWRLIIVDNASSDDSRERLRNLGADVTLVESPVNGGWTGGNMLGIDWALAEGYRTLFILNNDAFVEPDTIATLIAEHDAMGGHAAIGPVHLKDDGISLDFIGTEADDTTGFPHWRPVEGVALADLPARYPTSSIKGAGIFVDAESFERVGPLDDRFYLNFDETDWCERARAAGVPLAMSSRARIVHAGSASIGGLESPLHIYFMTRNSLLYAEKHCTLRQRLDHLRRLYWEARRRARAERPGKRWITGFLTARTPTERAFKCALADYARRRFGDCPPLIRELNRQR